MKKIILSLLAIAATMNVMAVTIDAKAKVTISANGAETSLLLLESSDLNAGWNNGYCGEIYDLSELPLALYIEYNGKNYASFGTKDLTATDIKLKAKDNGAASYTITVSGVEGSKALKLMFGTKELPLVNGTYTLTAAELAAATNVAEDAAAPSICFNMNKLEVKGYAGKNLKVMKGTDVVIAEAPVADDDETYDLSAQTGRLVVTLDGKEYQIDANPAVTVVP